MKMPHVSKDCGVNYCFELKGSQKDFFFLELWLWGFWLESFGHQAGVAAQIWGIGE